MEAGFYLDPTYDPAGLSETAEEDRAKLLQDTEGTSDKYVRKTICSWLKQMGWVEQAAKTAAEDAGTRRYGEPFPSPTGLR